MSSDSGPRRVSGWFEFRDELRGQLGLAIRAVLPPVQSGSPGAVAQTLYKTLIISTKNKASLFYIKSTIA